GPTFNVTYLTQFLSEKFETKLVGGEKDESEDSSTFILDQYGIEPIIIPEMKRAINAKLDFQAYKKISKLIREYKPHIVHTHASKSGTLGRLAAYNNNVPLIYHTFHGHVFHSYFGKLKTEFYKNLERYLAKKSTRIIAISNKQKKELSEIHRICSSEKIEVVPLGFDLSRFRNDSISKRNDFRSTYNLDPDTLAIGIVGRLVPIKNHKLFLDAIKNLSTDKKIVAFIIGDGELREELMEYSKSLGLKTTLKECSNDSEVVFTSWIRNVDWAYAGLDLVCLTSLNEGTPVSLIEAQAAGRAIISTNVGGVADIVKDRKTGIICDGTIESFGTALSELVNNSDLRKSYESEGWSNVERFSHLNLANNIEKLYLKGLS
ncbi:MAG: glycosyltransferase, partial [Flavobacteriales bacterium]|nr:glycosyltransferase [Flavobacteriales bacterium]